MKRKIATLLMFLFTCLSLFTGCNLFGSNNYSSLDAVVAKSGDIEITREQLITAYNSSGYYYYYYYGYTQEEAIKKTIDGLIERQYLLSYIDELAENDNRYKLNDQEKYEVITETWEYIDSSIESIVNEVREKLNLTVEDLSAESEDEEETEFSGKKAFETEFYKDSDGKIVKIMNSDNSYVPNKTVYDYKLKLSSKNKDYETLVWNKYISALKVNQKNYNNDKTDSGAFKYELERVYKSNYENALIEKFQNIYKSSFGLAYDNVNDRYYVNNKTLNDIIDAYSKTYYSNRELYEMSYDNKNLLDVDPFYSLVTNSSSRANYFYYGSPKDDETLISCLHILVKLSDEQLDNIESYESDSAILGQYLNEVIDNEKSQNNTFAAARDIETGKVIDENAKTSVADVYSELISRINSEVTVASSNSNYLNQVSKIFDDFIYKYNQDSGIINAEFDYIVGTKTSAMVSSFTEVVRDLYNNGEADYSPKYVTANYNEDVTLYFPYGVGFEGAISAPFLEENDNYSGYHIVLFTGTLKNIVADSLTISNVFDKLSKKTSIVYNETIFEKLYDSLVKDNYSSYQTNVVNSIKEDTIYNTNNYSDLY